MVKTDLKRTQIRDLLPPDVKFSLKKVDFTDLARDTAYELVVKRDGEELPSIFFGESHRDAWLDVIQAKARIKAQYTYKGCNIL